jgi:hypothetical protein
MYLLPHQGVKNGCGTLGASVATLLIVDILLCFKSPTDNNFEKY